MNPTPTNTSTGAALTAVPTYTANVHVGLENRHTHDYHTLKSLRDVASNFAEGVHICVSVTPTAYVYPGGESSGAIVGFINYPRFPREPEYIRRLALEFAERCLTLFDQQRISVVFPDETVMVSQTLHPTEAYKCSSCGSQGHCECP